MIVFRGDRSPGCADVEPHTQAAYYSYSDMPPLVILRRLLSTRICSGYVNCRLNRLMSTMLPIGSLAPPLHKDNRRQIIFIDHPHSLQGGLYPHSLFVKRYRGHVASAIPRLAHAPVSIKCLIRQVGRQASRRSCNDRTRPGEAQLLYPWIRTTNFSSGQCMNTSREEFLLFLGAFDGAARQ